MKFISVKDIVIPKRGSKKGDNGRLLIIGGSTDYAGCLALAGIAAMRSGCDWVTIAAPEKVAWAINTLSADLVTIKLPGNYISLKHEKKIKQLLETHDTLLIGNGIGLKSDSIIKRLVKLNIPKVIDADAIRSIGIHDTDNSIITPHKKEYEALIRNSTSRDLRKNIIVLKGPVDMIITKEGIFHNRTGNRGMTKAGTGDVLAGLCAGFLTQGLTLLQAAKNAVYINGHAGDTLKKIKGYTYLASDLADEIKRITKALSS